MKKFRGNDSHLDEKVVVARDLEFYFNFFNDDCEEKGKP